MSVYVRIRKPYFRCRFMLNRLLQKKAALFGSPQRRVNHRLAARRQLFVDPIERLRLIKAFLQKYRSRLIHEFLQAIRIKMTN
ncbi:hypothetical protein [Effusibacillus dendaii]|uniref:hypothetical protein n=1 Tax=Effusibacillus dendaii TaxID=2743772 RepID=UPI00384CB1E2